MDKILLHTCCGPCVTVPIERLETDYKITCYFYNPNIHPIEEYQNRLDELKNLLNKLNVELIEADYNPDDWFEAVKGFEDEPEGGKRCEICFRMRLRETARTAKHLGFDCFATVMSISPHKNAELLNRIGKELEAEFGITYLESNFKKKDGFKRSIELSKLHELYRQNYCGCIYSKR